jgi:hypothetical protein
MDQRQNVWQQKFVNHSNWSRKMKSFILGTVFGIVICTVGLTGIARMLDSGVTKVQEYSKEAAK